MKQTIKTLFQIASVLCWTSTAWAQANPSPPLPERVASFASSCDPTFFSIPLEAGDYTGLKLANRFVGRIARLQVSKGYEVQLFDGDNFTGSSITLASTASNCLDDEGWSNRTKSLKIRVATPPLPKQVARFAYSCNSPFGIPLEAGDYTRPALTNRFVNNIAGLQVSKGYEVQLFEGKNFTGASITLADTTFNCLDDEGWSNRANSLKIRVATPPSPLPERVASFASSCDPTFFSIPLEAGDYTGLKLANRFVGRIARLQVSKGYEVQLFDGDNFTGSSITLASTASNCLDDEGWSNRTKSLKIRAVIPAPTKANGPSQALGSLELYPNPTVDKLYLTSATSLVDGHYRIVNGWGKSLASGSLAKGPVDVAALPAGVYTLVVTAKNGQTITRRFVK